MEMVAESLNTHLKDKQKQWLMNLTRIHGDVNLTPDLAQWVEDPVLP